MSDERALVGMPEISTGHLKKMEAILDAIRRGNMTNAQIAKATGLPLEKCGKLLRQMRDEGILLAINRGKWTLRPTWADLQKKK